MTTEGLLMASAEVVVGPVVEPGENAVDQKTEGETSSEMSIVPPSLELCQVLRLQGLPQRLRTPAPRVLCRPSPLRRTKPCCTRSCYQALEHVVTFRYSKC